MPHEHFLGSHPKKLLVLYKTSKILDSGLVLAQGTLHVLDDLRGEGEEGLRDERVDEFSVTAEFAGGKSVTFTLTIVGTWTISRTILVFDGVIVSFTTPLIVV